MSPDMPVFDAQTAVDDLLGYDRDCWSVYIRHCSPYLARWAEQGEWRLHLSGFPRCGKTTLLSALARYLSRKSSGKTSVVVIFLEHIHKHTGDDKIASRVRLYKAILRATLQQLIKDLPRKNCESTLGELMSASDGDPLSLTRSLMCKWIKRLARSFRRVHVLVDDLFMYSALREMSLSRYLKEIVHCSGLFVGPPLLHSWHKYWKCDACETNKGPWAGSEKCGHAFCVTCFDGGVCRTCGQALEPFVAELPIQEPDLDAYIDKKLEVMYPEQHARGDVVRDLLKHSQKCLPLARLHTTFVLEEGRAQALRSERIRMAACYIRYYKLALHRVLNQADAEDARLGLAVLLLTAAAEPKSLSFDGLIELVRTSCSPAFSPPLERNRVSRVTQGWLLLEGRRPKYIEFFDQTARAFLNDECSHLYKQSILETGRR